MSRLVFQPQEKRGFLIGGFCSSKTSYEALRAELSTRTDQPVEFIGSCRWGRPPLGKNVFNLPRPLVRQAYHAILHVGSQSARIHLFGHSMGAAVALIVAFLMPGKVHRVYLLAPACMYKDKLLALFGRTLRKSRSDGRMAKSHPDPNVRKRMQGRTLGMLRYMSNIWRTIVEGIALGTNDVYSLLAAKLQEQGVEVFVLYAEHDELFPQTPEHPRLSGKNAIVLSGTTHDLQLYVEAVGDGIDKLHAAT